jgi:hypothetical protein
MAGPPRGAIGRPTTATTEVEDIDDWPPRCACRSSAAATTEVKDVDGGAPGLYLGM